MTDTKRSRSKPPPWESGGDNESASFGEWLRNQREVRDITLREIAEASKISMRYLEAFESERFDLLPASVFARGFLRQYARFVGLDADETVNRYLVARGEEEREGRGVSGGGDGGERGRDPGGTDARRSPRGAPSPSSSRPSSRPSSPSSSGSEALRYALLVIGAAVILLLLVFLVPRLTRNADSDGADNADLPPGVAPALLPATETPAVDAAADPAAGAGADAIEAPPAEPAVPLAVDLEFQESCWVEAFEDGRRVLSEMRVQGESLQLRAQESVELRLGNAGGVNVEVNGEPWPLDAGSGDVRTVRIGLADLPADSPTGPAPPN